MKKRKCILIFLVFFVLFPCESAIGQVNGELKTGNCKDSISCRIQLDVSAKCYNKIRRSRGYKPEFTEVLLNYNGLEIPVKSLKVRGKTSLYYPKKSFTLKLDKNIGIQGTEDTVFVKDCYLLGLTMDRNYIGNYTAYSILKYLHIFNLTFSYCEVVINNRSQGIYLIMERPEDYAFKTIKSPVLIRRGFNMSMDKIELRKESQAGSQKYFQEEFKHIYSLCNKYSGIQLYDSLNAYIDLSQYMRWLGFNYMARNGDYTDELYLYFNTDESRYEIIPWDYDDIFVLYPHEGKKARSAISAGQFIFSTEDHLDKTIIKDKYLYDKYLEELYSIADILNDSVLIEIYQKTLCLVYPYYLNEGILETTKDDKFGLTSMDELISNIRFEMNTLRDMRNMIRLHNDMDHR